MVIGTKSGMVMQERKQERSWKEKVFVDKLENGERQYFGLTFGAEIAWTSSEVFFHRLVMFKVWGIHPLLLAFRSFSNVISLFPHK